METSLPKDFFALKCYSEVNELINPLRDILEIDYFGHTRIYRDNSLTGLYSKLSVPNLWVEKNYCIPGSTDSGTKLKEGFYLASEIPELHSSGCLENIHKNLNLNNILYYIDKHPTFDDHYMFASNPDNKRAISNYINNMSFIEKFIHYYINRSKKLFEKVEKTRIILPTFNFNPEAYSKISPSTIKKYNLLNNFFKNEKKINIRLDNSTLIPLTKKQFIYLCLRSAGYTHEMMAKYFKVSIRTVDDHINVLKYKLHIEKNNCLVRIFWENAKEKSIFLDYLQLIISPPNF